MQLQNEELLQDILLWQSKRYIQLCAAMDSTKRLNDLVKLNDEESIDLELDVREAILGDLQTYDEEFKALTQDLNEEEISELLSKKVDAPNLSDLEKTLRKANKTSYDATYRLIEADKAFYSAYEKIAEGQKKEVTV